MPFTLTRMNHEDWMDRWVQGNIGWHQADGSATLRQFWNALHDGARVLVPLCGKSVDLLWLAKQGLDVTGVELSSVAIESFFSEHDLTYTCKPDGKLLCYRAIEFPIALHCGDYFEFEAPKFDALFDRASLIALNRSLRPKYVRHTQALLKADAAHLLITLEYDQSLVDGPPFCVMSDEVMSYWPALRSVKQEEGLASCPPKFRNAGVSHVNEITWICKQT